MLIGFFAWWEINLGGREYGVVEVNMVRLGNNSHSRIALSGGTHQQFEEWFVALDDRRGYFVANLSKLLNAARFYC